MSYQRRDPGSQQNFSSRKFANTYSNSYEPRGHVPYQPSSSVLSYTANTSNRAQTYDASNTSTYSNNPGYINDSRDRYRGAEENIDRGRDRTQPDHRNPMYPAHNTQQARQNSSKTMHDNQMAPIRYASTTNNGSSSSASYALNEDSKYIDNARTAQSFSNKRRRRESSPPYKKIPTVAPPINFSHFPRGNKPEWIPVRSRSRSYSPPRSRSRSRSPHPLPTVGFNRRAELSKNPRDDSESVYYRERDRPISYQPYDSSDSSAQPKSFENRGRISQDSRKQSRSPPRSKSFHQLPQDGLHNNNNYIRPEPENFHPQIRSADNRGSSFPHRQQSVGRFSPERLNKDHNSHSVSRQDHAVRNSTTDNLGYDYAYSNNISSAPRLSQSSSLYPNRASQPLNPIRSHPAPVYFGAHHTGSLPPQKTLSVTDSTTPTIPEAEAVNHSEKNWNYKYQARINFSHENNNETLTTASNPVHKQSPAPENHIAAYENQTSAALPHLEKPIRLSFTASASIGKNPIVLNPLKSFESQQSSASRAGTPYHQSSDSRMSITPQLAEVETLEVQENQGQSLSTESNNCLEVSLAEEPLPTSSVPTPTSPSTLDEPVSKASSQPYYKKVAQVGEGTYGKVYKALAPSTGRFVALKRIKLDAEKDGFPVTALREIKLLQSLSHPNIIKLWEMMVQEGAIHMVFEYMDHDLTGLLTQPSIDFSPANLKSLASQMLSGLAYLHQKGILHRDMKGSNILLNGRGQLKLADFGLARFFAKRRAEDYTNRVITLWYRPIELLLGATVYGAEVDMWSAGQVIPLPHVSSAKKICFRCIFLELFTRRPIFQGNDEIHQLDAIYKIFGTPDAHDWPGASNLPWYELVKPKSVLTNRFRESFKKWLTPAGLDMAEALLTFNPVKRPTALEALSMPYFTSEEPSAQMPTKLSSLVGEWHEFESKREKAKKRKVDQSTKS